MQQHRSAGKTQVQTGGTLHAPPAEAVKVLATIPTADLAPAKKTSVAALKRATVPELHGAACRP